MPPPFLDRMEKVPYLGQTLLRWQCGPSTFVALPEKGARLMNWHMQLGDGTVRDVIYWPELENADELGTVQGGNGVFFPFTGPCFDEGLPEFWRAADGERRPMPAQSLTRDAAFRLTRLDGRGFAAQLIPDDNTRSAYPYDFEFEVTFRFEAYGLACEFTLRNLDTVPIPWCAGQQYFFTVPWSEHTHSADYVVRIPATKTHLQDLNKTGLLVSGPQLKPVEPLTNPELRGTYHSGLKNNSVVLAEKEGGTDIHLKFGTKDVPHPDHTLRIWSEEGKESAICMQALMGPANAPAHKAGLHWVPPGQSQNFLVQVAIK